MTSICDLKSSTLESLKKENYKSIIEYLGFEDISFLIDLFKISQIDNYSIKEFAIEKHIEKYGESALALFSKASCKSNLGKKEEAKVLYEKSLKLDSQNSFTWNNLGFLLDKQFNQINKALECYNKAIDLEPNLIVARINRATVYSRKNKNKKAKEEYLKILEISPSEPKAHNNLANIYRQYKDKEKVLYHFVEAIKFNPTYAEAYLNLANYYDVELFDYENALQYYNVAKRLCKNESFELIIDKLIEMLNDRKQDK